MSIKEFVVKAIQEIGAACNVSGFESPDFVHFDLKLNSKSEVCLPLEDAVAESKFTLPMRPKERTIEEEIRASRVRQPL